ncbi:probable 2-oxoglutarate dehydrogenase E1 component DHKTD1 homolog, mitochondrial [Tribolium castaneum]|uniref:Putative 2-oxoglutarate dehydrogenase E1 component DHKTD1 homolog, mitochondrial-like Protein n=1 Tax=Tribolium castaneum TaxID=7070 RepID=D6WSA2_TRICA|nr:PREDICTED: probable 2-oxoglutarate dehydrogenase E1 component DHKTD1 homolog, mitochondrial [Tribolium castaneum]XP_008196255.1 PREDICTED: probable 2-oxoglutarate dehydrogenase E1 component DHKTD1 homolog, mitochondrial [Tribolium castaneum]EFA05916.2 putative 2-oxoglutarate dehydrogenase E1 component DHKTD1 homolog, mitochondrial-like Protein [Tribolium castaneum]|eukprot:XP_008196254.1 PREDICTED: probable 2-oxoglutarate dehydrogenase E1 component DHKTD1 homolog, mitochondrial [Tribolium castaneum]
MYLKVCKTNLLQSARKQFRNYHSDNVFGFKRKSKHVYTAPEQVLKAQCDQSNFFRLVSAFRQNAHKTADVNPVALTREVTIFPDFDPKRYCLDPDTKIKFTGILNTTQSEGTVAEAVDFLRHVYGKNIAAEFTHLENPEEIDWFCNRLEQLVPEEIDTETKLRLATELLRSQNFDNFLANKFTGVKRYGGEGAESMMAFFSEFFRLAAGDSVEQLVVAMPHRGRLNLLTGMLNFPPVKMFAKLKGKSNFSDKYRVTGDVLSHFVSSTDLKFGDKNLHVTLLYNPSHLEAVNPVSMGKTRAKQLESRDGDYGDGRWGDKIINLQVHGDAAITGQGVNQECLALSGTPHFEIGGSIHLVVNNQLGFTTPADRGRSSRYCTDLAKMISAPVIHVNGDFPEMVLKATKLAFEYQRKFRKEVFIDMNCYRQWGHNELDDPTFTNPSLYGIIRSRGTVPDQYTKKLIDEGILNEEEKNTIIKEHTKWLNEHLKAVDSYKPDDVYFKKQWEGFSQADEAITTWDTGIHLDLLTYIGSKSVQFPEHFNVHPTLLKTHVKNRLARVAEGVNIDWSTAETLAFGSLLYEGYNIRISGQDVGRGTFSHRHVMLVDQQTNHIYIPLNNLHENQGGFLEIANSILSEEAVLGYEYGMSIESPKNLIIWEAQFGDFFNGAQIIFDTFVSNGEVKWLWSSGLVVLLPHGYDGAGPEHSSARIERFLQMTDSKEDKVDGDNVNMQVCHPSTPAQYFHLLRRQMLRNFRKPLIVIGPKTLLRLPEATSNFADMGPQTTFQPVITDNTHDPKQIQVVLLTSGKHFYNLASKRESLGAKNVAIVRLESYCPFPTLELQQEVAKFPNAKIFMWCQEEPQNMGAWSFVKPRFENLVGRKIQFCGRPTQAAPAVGIGELHDQQVSEILSKPFSFEI